jgi:hypothetical protein
MAGQQDRFLPDVEGGEPFRGFGLEGNGFHDGQTGAGHAVLLGEPPAAIAEEDTLHPAGDQHPIAHHKQTVPGPGTRPPGRA